MENRINVLIPTDFTSNANNSLEYGVFFLDKFNCEIILQHVFEPYEIDTEAPPVIEIVENKNEEKIIEIKNTLETICEEIQKIKPELALNCIISKGSPADEIIETANARGINLIIMGNTIKSRMNRLILGNLTNKIIERSPCPVLVIPHNTTFHNIKNIAYAAILTETDIWKINQLTVLAKAFDSSIHIIHIAPKEDIKPKYGLREFKIETKKSITYEKLYFESIPSENIVNGIEEYIYKHEIELISMSTRTSMGLQKLFNKSITKKISSDIDIPLLIFHYDKED